MRKRRHPDADLKARVASPLLGQIAANWIFDGAAERLTAQQRAIAKRR
jgi:hypothetical protein